MKRRLSFIWILLAQLCVLQCKPSSERSANMSETKHLNLRLECVGRFCMSIPASMERRAETYRIRWTDVAEEVYQTHHPDKFEQLWQKHIADIEELKSDRILPDDLHGKVLDWRELEANRIRLLRYHENNPRLITVASLRDEQNYAVWVSKNGSLSRVDSVEATTKEVMQSYKAQARPQPGKLQFFLAKGALELPFSEDEEANASFGEYPGLEFEVEIATTDEEQPGLLERFVRGVADFGMGLVSPVSIKSQRARTVAGLKGREMILRDGNKDELSYLWVHPGKVKSAQEPEIHLSMDAKPNQQKEAELVWNTILDSMRPAWK